MVGRTRSKGCITCKSRHVKCDEAKPFCIRCRRAKLDCQGYEEIVFVNHSVATRKDKGKKTKPTETCSLFQQNGHADHEDHMEVDSDSSSGSSEEDDLEVVAQDNTNTITELIHRRRNSLPSTPDMQPWEDSFYMAFALQTTFKGFERDSDPVLGERGVWTTIDFVDYVTSPLTNRCLTALHAASFAKRNGEPQALAKSRSLYGQVLREVNRKIDDPEECCSSSTLIAIVTSGVYELMNQTSPTAWLSHAVGLTRMIRTRGPESFQNPVDLRLFENCRFFIMTAAVTVRKPCIFASHRWVTVPWASDLIKRPLYQYLVDILLQLGGLLYRIDTARNLYASQAPEAEEYGMEIDRTLKDLYQEGNNWRDRWILCNSDKIQEVARSLDPQLDLEPLSFESEWFFDDLYAAHTTTSYLILVITLCSSVLELESITGRPVFPAQSTDPQPVISIAGLSLDDSTAAAEKALPRCATLPDPISTMTRAGISTCQCIRYHLEEQHDGAGMVYLLPPIQFTYHAVGGESSPEGRWLTRVMSLIGSDRAGGWDFAKRLVEKKFAADTVEVLD